jgi:cell wall-associated NlpC family hydrolase
MKIAVISFADLVNQPNSGINQSPLRNRSNSADARIKSIHPFTEAKGLRLPIRLGRVSRAHTQNRRMTNVLCPGASLEKVFYAKSKHLNLNDAIKDLREKEGIASENYQSIGYVNLNNGKSRARMNDVAVKASKWAKENGFDAVIWSDLPTKGVKFDSKSTGREVLPILKADATLLKNTQNYIAHLSTPLNSLQKDILKLGKQSSPQRPITPIRLQNSPQHPDTPVLEISPQSPVSSVRLQESSVEEEQSPIEIVENNAYQASLTADFAERDRMPQTNTPKADWFKPAWGKWGPYVKKFPAPAIPADVNPVEWKRDRIIEAALHYKGLPYKRLSDGMRAHFPERGCGLDCSNFASWVYNYGLGVLFTSHVDEQINGVDSQFTGRKIPRGDELKKGDLVYFKGNPNHVVIYIDENHIIDSTSGQSEGVDIRDLRLPENKWCRPIPGNPRFLFARRPIE